MANLPNIPTMQELGFKDFEATTFSGITVPRGTPREVINKLNADIGAVIASDEFKAYIKGDVIVGGSPEEFGRVIDQDYAVWGKVAKDIDLKAE
jgi:tripartite-type tricarboxylate transporter receptor subunit TctC